MGMKIKKKPTKKRILSVVKRGTFSILPLLGVLLVSGAAGIAKAINDNKATSIGRTENASWKVIYLVPYKRG